MRPHRYQWMIDRARSGEPVPIDQDRRDIDGVIAFLLAVDGRGLLMQIDTTGGLIWLLRRDPTEVAAT